MNGTEFLFAVGDRVKLRDGIDPSFYEGMSKVGNEGWVTAHRRDRFGLPEVYVRWDPNHWAYNRQRDGWTYQEHFDPVKEQKSVSDKADQAREAALTFANQIASIFVQDDPGAPAAAVVEQRTAPTPMVGDAAQDEVAEYAQDIEKARTVALGSESFITLAITRKPDDRAPQGALHLEVVGNALTPEASALLGAHLSRIGADCHMTSATSHILRYAAQREKGPDGGAE